MGKVFQFSGPGGGRLPYPRHVLQVYCPGDPLVWIIDLGDDPQNWAYHWKIPPHSGLMLYGDETTEGYGMAVGISTFVGGYGGSRTRGGGYLRPPLP